MAQDIIIALAITIGVPLLLIAARLLWALWQFSHWDGR